MTVAATIATAPLIALHFGRVSLVGLPANVLAAPAVAPAMWLGALAAAIGQVSAALASPIAALAALPTAYLAWLGHAAAHLPGANTRLPLGVVIALCGAAAAWIALPHRGRRRWSRRGVPVLALLALALLAVAAVARHRPVAPGAAPALRISFLDVGQGDATLIQAGGRAVLVDAGPVGDHVASLVRREGARRLDLLVITHAQADHEGGAADVLSQLPVTAILDGRDGLDRRTAHASKRPRTHVGSVCCALRRARSCAPARSASMSSHRRATAGSPARTRTPARSCSKPASPASGSCSRPTRSPTCSRHCRSSRSTSSRCRTTAAPTPAYQRCSASCVRAPRSSRSAATTPTATRLPRRSARSQGIRVFRTDHDGTIRFDYDLAGA